MIRISILTYNLWNTQRWPQRQPALLSFFQRFHPDIFCLQELQPVTLAALAEALPGYLHIADPFPGWQQENNIFWNAALFQQEAHGAEEIGIHTDPYRRLFWARLRHLVSGKTLLVATAHYTHQEHEQEITTGVSPRLRQVQATIAALSRLSIAGEAAFFMGDLNDPVLPTYHLAEAGYHSCFARLNLVPPPTWPAFPTANRDRWTRLTNQTIDWLVANNAAQPVMAAVPRYYDGDYSPSDHWPVWALYEI